MNNQNIDELITTLEKAVALANALPTPMGDFEDAKKVDELTIQLRESIHPKKPVQLKGFVDINYF